MKPSIDPAREIQAKKEDHLGKSIDRELIDALNDEEEGPSYCHTCNNTGEVDCYCGGDLCVCDNYGEEACTECGGI